MKKILIVGGGIAGLCAALNFAHRKANVHVFEQAKAFGDVGAGIQLSANAMHVLTWLGLADTIADMAFEPHNAIMRHYHTGKPYLSVPLKDVHQHRYGARYLHIHRADVIEALRAGAQQAGVHLHLNQTATGYQHNGKTVTLHLHNAAPQDGDLLISADGIRSRLRTIMLGDRSTHFTGQVAWRGLVPTKALPRNTIPQDATVWLGPGRHFVSYYVRRGTHISFVAVEERAAWAEEDWHKAGDMAELRTAFDGWDAPVTNLLAQCQQSFLWGLFDHPPLARWHDGHVALIGDACHPMLPFMAQGGAMAIEDAYVLAEQVMCQADIPTALERYETIRKPRTTMLQTLSRANAAMFHARNWRKRLSRQLQFGLARLIPLAARTRLDKVYAVNVTTSIKI